jgi:hypothetical protein
MEAPGDRAGAAPMKGAEGLDLHALTHPAPQPPGPRFTPPFPSRPLCLRELGIRGGRCECPMCLTEQLAKRVA